MTQQQRWLSSGSLGTFALSVLCIVVYFAARPEVGWWPPLLLIFGPVLFAILGVVLGVFAKKWVFAALNVLPALVFPAVMFFGTLILGP